MREGNAKLRTRRTHPSPTSFAQEIEEVIDSLDDLIPLYAEMDEYVYDRRDSAIGATGRISGGGRNDPTAATVSEQEGNKARIRRVMEDVKRIRVIIDGNEKNEWNGLREKLLKIYDPPEHEPLASFRNKGQGPDRRAQAEREKVTRYASRLRRVERNARRVG